MVHADDPYFNLHLRESGRSLDAMIDVRNLLDQGGRSFMLSDGTLLLFAQAQRGVTAGLAFTF